MESPLSPANNVVKLIRRDSPNLGPRPAGVEPSLVVLHADVSRSVEGTLSWICSPLSKVSYHYLISRTGNVYELVHPLSRAWHCGRSAYEGVPACNDYSIGVCFSNAQDYDPTTGLGGEPFQEEAITAGAQLVRELRRRFPAIGDRIATHAAVALPPGRKHDPGPRFPLEQFLSLVRSA